MKRMTPGYRVFTICNYLFLTITGVVCLLPFINLFAISLSGSYAVNAGDVGLLPVGFTLKSYEFIMSSDRFLRAMGVSVLRAVLGVSVNVLLMVCTAYPLSRGKGQLAGRSVYVWFFVLTMLIGGGMIPLYITVIRTHLIDSIWSLILPSALPVYNTIILMNFFRGLPRELEEAAMVDGATHWTILWRVLLPVSKPAIATVSLFCVVGHWNSWFDGLIYMNNIHNYPLQTYLQTVIVNPEDMLRTAGTNYGLLLAYINARTTRAAQLFIGALPILLVYPFLQKHFASGLVLGSVKG